MVKASKVKVTPFILEDFIGSETAIAVSNTVNKKELKSLAKELNLAYDDEHINFAKKLINAYIKKR